MQCQSNAGNISNKRHFYYLSRNYRKIIIFSPNFPLYHGIWYKINRVLTMEYKYED